MQKSFTGPGLKTWADELHCCSEVVLWPKSRMHNLNSIVINISIYIHSFMFNSSHVRSELGNRNEIDFCFLFQPQLLPHSLALLDSSGMEENLRREARDIGQFLPGWMDSLPGPRGWPHPPWLDSALAVGHGHPLHSCPFLFQGSFLLGLKATSTNLSFLQLISGYPQLTLHTGCDPNTPLLSHCPQTIQLWGLELSTNFSFLSTTWSTFPHHMEASLCWRVMGSVIPSTWASVGGIHSRVTMLSQEISSQIQILSFHRLQVGEKIEDLVEPLNNHFLHKVCT